MKYLAYNLQNYRQIKNIGKLPEQRLFEMEVVAQVFPFRTNSYVVDELIDWDNYDTDPLFRLNFPQADMLRPHHFKMIETLLKTGASQETITQAANHIRMELNPHPAGQIEHNVPIFNGERLSGMQHKYRETALIFPYQGQTCHSYCTFCFRWPQFLNIKDLKFALRQTEAMVQYIKQCHCITDVLITGGDPMIMNAKNLAIYINALVDAKIPHLKTIRIGSKSLSYFPYRYVTDPDAVELLALFRKVVDAGIHLAFMAHINHYRELELPIAEEAVKAIKSTGAEIRTQSPVLQNINADALIWKKMWKRQIQLGMVPYYFFLARDTGAQHFFAVPLVKAWEIFRSAYSEVTGIARTVRGPIMSAFPGKIQVVGVSKIGNEKVIVLNFVQGRNADWVGRPFFAKYDEKAIWIDDLKPAFNEEEFFFEKNFRYIIKCEEELEGSACYRAAHHQ